MRRRNFYSNPNHTRFVRQGFVSFFIFILFRRRQDTWCRFAEPQRRKANAPQKWFVFYQRLILFRWIARFLVVQYVDMRCVRTQRLSQPCCCSISHYATSTILCSGIRGWTERWSNRAREEIPKEGSNGKFAFEKWNRWHRSSKYRTHSWTDDVCALLRPTYVLPFIVSIVSKHTKTKTKQSNSEKVERNETARSNGIRMGMRDVHRRKRKVCKSSTAPKSFRFLAVYAISSLRLVRFCTRPLIVCAVHMRSSSQ